MIRKGQRSHQRSVGPPCLTHHTPHQHRGLQSGHDDSDTYAAERGRLGTSLQSPAEARRHAILTSGPIDWPPQLQALNLLINLQALEIARAQGRPSRRQSTEAHTHTEQDRRGEQDKSKSKTRPCPRSRPTRGNDGQRPQSLVTPPISRATGIV